MAAATLAAALLVACGPPKAATGGNGADTPATPRVTRVVDETSLYLLESWGAPPTDTALTTPGGERRVVLMRHAPPDNSPFVELILPEGATPAGGSIDLALQPVPGVYGVDLAAPAAFTPSATLVFKYPVHFAAPAGARERYGGDVPFEQALLVGHVLPDGRVALLPVTRPAADNIAAIIPGPGRYLVVAPK